MALFARSDIASVIIPPAHGGCGSVHSRPVANGAPVPIWEFDHAACPRCAAVLSKDAHWSGTISEIPETPDEKIIREDRDKRGAADQAKATALALEKIGMLPENLAAALMALAGGQQAPAAAAVACPAGHQNPAAAKFCGECGAAVGAPADEPASTDGGSGGDDDEGLLALSRLKAAELRQLAQERGLDTSGTRADLLERLRAAAS